ncbi:unnamed protein product [Diamesa serratosioi]
MWLLGCVILTLNVFSQCSDELVLEAVFQGHCGHGSPCDQLCYQLHDGMYECDCTDGFELDPNGYSCRALNSTFELLNTNNIVEINQIDEDILYQKSMSFSAHLEGFNNLDIQNESSIMVNDSLIENKMLIEKETTNINISISLANSSLETVNSIPSTETTISYFEAANIGSIKKAEELCNDTNNGINCKCPFQKSGKNCVEDEMIRVPRFGGNSWLAFPTFRGAYKHLQIYIEFKPETYQGMILLSGERDDLTGDFMALLINEGFIEFWFDCGSGSGFIKTKESVLLNVWNTITIYRHRWDAWILLNQNTKVYGRSKGLFSRMTFREPVFLGGSGNVTGFINKLPVSNGFFGCVRKFVANEHVYKFDYLPSGDVSKGFDINECTVDECDKYPCHHGGKCLNDPTNQGSICLCPLGFRGDYCEMKLDLMVPFFNGTSYLRYTPLGNSAIIWMELKIVLKAQHIDGVILFSGHHEFGDYIALCLNMGFVEFTFDLGSGIATVRSEFPITLGEWVTIKVSRTARLAVMKVDMYPEVMIVSPNGFWHLSLPHSFFVGGVQSREVLPSNLRERGSFIGCIQKIEVNDKNIDLIEDALGGSDVENCEHACISKPCGKLAYCIPKFDNYECQCNPQNEKCNHAEEVSMEALIRVTVKKKNRGTCFSDSNSFYQFKDSDTLKRIIYNHIDLNLRFKTLSSNGLILWTGSYTNETNDNYLSLGIENGYMHMRYNFGTSDISIAYNSTKVNDGLWHRVRALRKSQNGNLKVDGGLPITKRSTGKSKQLKTNTKLFIGGMPNIRINTLNKYNSGITGCISEVQILGSELQLNLESSIIDTKRNTDIS